MKVVKLDGERSIQWEFITRALLVGKSLYELRHAMAFCNEGDRFSKAAGLRLALARAMKGLAKEERAEVWKAVVPEILKYAQAQGEMVVEEIKMDKAHGLPPLVTVAEFKRFVVETGYAWTDPDGQYPLDPVRQVSARDAEAFCQWAGGRLITEEEWVEGIKTTPLCGLWEWTSTEDEGLRVLRGGSWYCNPGAVRASFRDRSDEQIRSGVLGFRCVPKEIPDVNV